MFLPEPDLITFVIKWIDFGKNPHSRLGTDFESFVRAVVMVIDTYNA